MGNTISGINHDPAIIRIPNSKKALVLSTSSCADMCRMNPIVGAMMVITRCVALVKNVGATPIAITNCLNFGNPETPEIMNEFAFVIEAMADICKELDLPVVSGNVSFYNETDGKGILPTPVIGIVGLIEDYENRYNNFSG
jgi:phosphoribosylformylglycinamidine synthase